MYFTMTLMYTWIIYVKLLLINVLKVMIHILVYANWENKGNVDN